MFFTFFFGYYVFIMKEKRNFLSKIIKKYAFFIILTKNFVKNNKNLLQMVNKYVIFNVLYGTFLKK